MLRYNVVFTGLNRHSGEPCTVQNIHAWFDTAEAAAEHGNTVIADAASFQDDGTRQHDGRTFYWTFRPITFRVHSYGYVAPRPLPPEPLSGPEWDRAWLNGPGRDAA